MIDSTHCASTSHPAKPVEPVRAYLHAWCTEWFKSILCFRQWCYLSLDICYLRHLTCMYTNSISMVDTYLNSTTIIVVGEDGIIPLASWKSTILKTSGCVTVRQASHPAECWAVKPQSNILASLHWQLAQWCSRNRNGFPGHMDKGRRTLGMIFTSYSSSNNSNLSPQPPSCLSEAHQPPKVTSSPGLPFPLPADMLASHYNLSSTAGYACIHPS